MKASIPSQLLCVSTLLGFSLAACAPTPPLTPSPTLAPTWTPAATPTITPTATITPPPTPSLPPELTAEHAGVLTAYNYDFEFENNQLSVDWQDGQGLRLAGTYDEATQTWDWEYFQYGGPPLTDTELNALATKDELCNFEILPGNFADKCIFPNPKGELKSLFKESVVATGRTAYGDYSDPFGNTGKQFLTEVMSFGLDGKPFTHWVQTSIVLDGQPGINILEFIYNGINRSDNFGLDQVPVGVDDLRGIWQRGRKVHLSYLLDPNEDNYRNKPGFKQNPAYYTLLTSFINAGGFNLNQRQTLQPVGAIWPKP